MIGFITLTVCLNNEVTVRVAITLTDAVVPAVTSISSLGTGNVRSVNGISIRLTSAASCFGLGGLPSCFLSSSSSNNSSNAGVITPVGGAKTLGATTIVGKLGISAVGCSNVGVAISIAPGIDKATSKVIE